MKTDLQFAKPEQNESPSRTLRICIDLDGTICKIRGEDETYADLEPIPGAVEAIKKLHSAGHTIIIHTARNMATCNHNVGKVVKNVGKITLEWLDRHGILYDEIFFGKPNADITIDDRVVRFENNWGYLSPSYLLKHSKEK